MKRQPLEVYGFGARMKRRGDPAATLARVALLAVVLGLLAGVVWP